MLITIIAPVYNVEPYIHRFVQSILIQSSKDCFELLLVDDCGKDASISIAESLLETSDIHYRIVRRKKNGGLSAARNSGIEVATGNYIYFADSDDVLEPNAVELLLNSIAQAKDAKILFFNARFKNINETELKHWRNAGLLPKEIAAERFLEYLYTGKIGAYIWQFLFDKHIFQNLRFKEGAVWEDAIFVPQAVSLVDSVICDDSCFIYQYLLRPGSISQSIHPQIDHVIAGLNEVENRLYPTRKEKLYPVFVEFRTSLLMRLSRECFTRSHDYKRLMEIHAAWRPYIPLENIATLWHSSKKKSAIFLWMTKTMPWGLYWMYKAHFLK